MKVFVFQSLMQVLLHYMKDRNCAYYSRYLFNEFGSRLAVPLLMKLLPKNGHTHILYTKLPFQKNILPCLLCFSFFYSNSEKWPSVFLAVDSGDV